MELQIQKMSNGMISISVPYDKDIVNKLRRIPLRKWDKEMNCWLIPLNNYSVIALENIFGKEVVRNKLYIDKKTSKDNNNIKELSNLLRIKNYSNKTKNHT